MFQVFFKYLITLIFLNIVVTASAESLLTTEKDGSVYSPNITPSDSNAENEESPDFMHGTLASFSVTVFSELGDKTFFLAAILAMKQSRMQVFIGALSALAPMTVLSVIFGMAASVVPKFFMQFVSSLLLAIFGFNMLKEGITMTPEEGLQEFEKCKKDLDSSNGKADKCFAITQAFTLTLLGELGDRSQIATILLATTENAYGVALGGILGHAMCTAAAVLGGRLLAHNIPVKTMTTVGGIVFLIFALTTWMF